MNSAAYSADEERTLFELWAGMGNRWSAIAEHLVGRTESSVKNRFNSAARRVQRAAGCTPADAAALLQRYALATTAVTAGAASAAVSAPALVLPPPSFSGWQVSANRGSYDGGDDCGTIVSRTAAGASAAVAAAAAAASQLSSSASKLPHAHASQSSPMRSPAGVAPRPSHLQHSQYEQAAIDAIIAALAAGTPLSGEAP